MKTIKTYKVETLIGVTLIFLVGLFIALSPYALNV